MALPSLDSAPAKVTASAKAFSLMAFFCAAIPTSFANCSSAILFTSSATSLASAIVLSLAASSAASNASCFSFKTISLAASSSSTATWLRIASSLNSANCSLIFIISRSLFSCNVAASASRKVFLKFEYHSSFRIYQ